MSETSHYRLYSTATFEQTRQVGRAVEALHRAYRELLPLPVSAEMPRRLELVLYRDRAEFRRYNRGPAWAEAYYRAPRCHAYVDANVGNAYHWMLHEATHQLQREVSGFRRVRWMDEGLASYFGSSRLVDGELQAGTPDPQAYPIWHLGRYPLSGDMQRDIDTRHFIPLEQLITGQGAPDIGSHVNAYYVNDWSLTHFLLHGEGGRYAQGYRELLGGPAGVLAFETSIGPLPQIQREWYEHLLAQARTQRSSTER